MILAVTLPKYFVEPYYITYHSLILIALLLSCFSYKRCSKTILFLMLVLMATFIVESITGYVIINNKKGFGWIYHIYNPFEYTLFCLYYLRNCNNSKYKSLVAWSIPLFILFGLYVSFFMYHFKSLPALNIDVEGLLLFIIYTHLLFNVNVGSKMFIYMHPDFWISSGILIFFGGVFVLFGLYPLLNHLDDKATMNLFDMIAKPLNIILYNFFIIGFIWIIRNKKYSIQ